MNFEIILLIYSFINLLSFSAYGIDKLKAIKNEWRIQENTLIFFSFLGPIGSLIGMFLFRHKIRKIKFITLVPIFMLLHIMLTYYFLFK